MALVLVLELSDETCNRPGFSLAELVAAFGSKAAELEVGAKVYGAINESAEEVLAVFRGEEE